MRLVIWHDMQFDADNLPPFVNAAECVDHDEYFGRKPKVTPAPPVTPSKSSGRRQRGTNRSDD